MLRSIMAILYLLTCCTYLQLLPFTSATQRASNDPGGGARDQRPAVQVMSLRSVFRQDIYGAAGLLQIRDTPEDSLFTYNDGTNTQAGVSQFSIYTRHEAITCALPKAQVVGEAELSMSTGQLIHGDDDHHWEIRQSIGPDISHKETLVNLAKMSSDAYYVGPSDSGWLNTSQGFNESIGFGWDSDRLSGQVFVSDDNSTVIIAYKGTSIWPIDRGHPQDRVNDNLLFSCCCATQRPNPYWYGKVCDCRQDVYRCNSTCLTQELASPNRYYVGALQVYANLTARYPKARMWTVGHSLGGAIASLVGLTYNIPAITFEMPAQRLAAERLGLAIPHDLSLLSMMGQYHFGNTADPVYMGSCNGAFSTCAAAGINFESQCFTGLRCVYDTVEDKKWYSSIIHHRLNNVIPNVFEAYDGVANCTLDDECVDCYNWDFLI